jgi:hypothetical protein
MTLSFNEYCFFIYNITKLYRLCNKNLFIEVKPQSREKDEGFSDDGYGITEGQGVIPLRIFPG